MKEFRDAHAHATGNGRKKFLIPILCNDVTVGELDTDLKFYLDNHTYIEYKNQVTISLFGVRIKSDKINLLIHLKTFLEMLILPFTKQIAPIKTMCKT